MDSRLLFDACLEVFAGGGGVHSISCMGVVVPSHPLQCRDGARRVFTDQADIARTKREAP